jgi:hypothetical protein
MASSSSTHRLHSLPTKRLTMIVLRTYDVTHYRSLHTYAPRTGFMLRNTTLAVFVYMYLLSRSPCVYSLRPWFAAASCLQVSVIVSR